MGVPHSVRFNIRQSGILKEWPPFFVVPVASCVGCTGRGAEHEVIRIPVTAVLETFDSLINVVLTEKLHGIGGKQDRHTASLSLWLTECAFILHVFDHQLDMHSPRSS